MNAYSEIYLQQEQFLLLPQKAMYRPFYRQLIFGDVHLGKASHFRKQGVAMPPQSHLKDIDTIHYLLNTWTPRSVIILGDLFHSDYNREWLWFKALLAEYPATQFILVEGNHDILTEDAYALPNLIRIAYIEETQLIFSHHPLDRPAKFNICAHVHPGIQLYGNARQSVKLPCFYKSPTHLILPAFGNLTGLHLLEREEGSEYYLVSGNRVMKL